jgi:hypothetical protein
MIKVLKTSTLEKKMLTEPGVRNYVLNSLQKCKEFKLEYYTKIVNLCLLGAFVLLVVGILYYKYRGKMTPEERKTKMEADRIYILNKIKQVQLSKQKESNMIITDEVFPEHYR